MATLAEKFPKTKFLKGISDKIVPNFPDRQLPYILYYKDGKLQKGLQRLEFRMAVSKISELSIRNLLGIIGIKCMEFKTKNENVKSTYKNTLGWNQKGKQRKESFDSSDEEREFISNQIQFK